MPWWLATAKLSPSRSCRLSARHLGDAEAVGSPLRAQPLPKPPPEIEGEPLELLVPVQFQQPHAATGVPPKLTARARQTALRIARHLVEYRSGAHRTGLRWAIARREGRGDCAAGSYDSRSGSSICTNYLLEDLDHISSLIMNTGKYDVLPISFS